MPRYQAAGVEVLATSAQSPVQANRRAEWRTMACARRHCANPLTSGDKLAGLHSCRDGLVSRDKRTVPNADHALASDPPDEGHHPIARRVDRVTVSRRKVDAAVAGPPAGWWALEPTQHYVRRI